MERQAVLAVYGDELGASLVEYIMLTMLIAIAAIAGMTFIGKAADNQLNNVTLQTQPN